MSPSGSKRIGPTARANGSIRGSTRRMGLQSRPKFSPDGTGVPSYEILQIRPEPFFNPFFRFWRHGVPLAMIELAHPQRLAVERIHLERLLDERPTPVAVGALPADQQERTRSGEREELVVL